MNKSVIKFSNGWSALEGEITGVPLYFYILNDKYWSAYTKRGTLLDFAQKIAKLHEIEIITQ